MNIKPLFFTLLLAAALVGCSKHPEPRHIVILIDVSGSIDRASLNQVFKAIGGLASHLQRGDRIVIIPILGDAEAQASGRIIRFDVPITRQAYDSDLRHFQVQLKNALGKAQADAVSHPGPKTDILGSIMLADEEFKGSPDHSRHLLIVLSDFIQESTGLDFKASRYLQTPAAARKFAVQIAKNHAVDFHGLPVYLGLLQSKEYSALPLNRREAIRGFWLEYFKAAGAQAQLVADGPSLLSVRDAEKCQGSS
jgi:hypothetical protein